VIRGCGRAFSRRIDELSLLSLVIRSFAFRRKRMPAGTLSNVVSDTRCSWACAGASRCPGSGRLHPSMEATQVAEAPAASVRRRAVMGNLYPYAMRKCSLSVCQVRHGQSSGSVVVSWRDGVACGRPSPR